MDLVHGNYLHCSIGNSTLLKMKNQTFDCEASNIFGKKTVSMGEEIGKLQKPLPAIDPNVLQSSAVTSKQLCQHPDKWLRAF